jgi:hypothetical protein
MDGCSHGTVLIDYLFSQCNDEKKLQTAENGSKNWGRTCVDIILYTQLEGGNTSLGKNGRRVEVRKLCVCTEK